MTKCAKYCLTLLLVFVLSLAVCWAEDLSGMTDQQILQRILQNSETMQNLSNSSLNSQKNVLLQFTEWEQRLQTVEQNLTNQSLLQNEFSSSMKKTANSFQNFYEGTMAEMKAMKKEIKTLKIVLTVGAGALVIGGLTAGIVAIARGGR